MPTHQSWPGSLSLSLAHRFASERVALLTDYQAKLNDSNTGHKITAKQLQAYLEKVLEVNGALLGLLSTQLNEIMENQCDLRADVQETARAQSQPAFVYANVKSGWHGTRAVRT